MATTLARLRLENAPNTRKGEGEGDYDYEGLIQGPFLLPGGAAHSYLLFFSL